MAKRASPGVGRATIGDNSGLPSHADVRTAVAIEMIFEEKAKKLREELKLARKRIESMKINKDDTTFLKGLRDKTGAEIEDLFKRQWHLVGAIHQDRYEQLDIFAPKPSAPERRAAHYTLGLLRGLQGKDLDIPPLTVGDDRQQMIDGYNEGRERFDAANAAILAQALDNAANGKVTDGTGKAPAVNEQAAADFAKDEGDDPLVVDGIKYANMRQANAARKRKELAAAPKAGDQAEDPAGDQGASFLTDESTSVIGDDHPAPEVQTELVEEEIVAPPAEPVKKVVARPDFHAWGDDWEQWTGPQTMEFRRWFESLPEASVPAITHPGAVAYFNLLREEQANRKLAETPEEEWEAAAPKPAEEESLDPDVIAAKAKELAESGFVPPKAGRRRRADA